MSSARQHPPLNLLDAVVAKIAVLARNAGHRRHVPDMEKVRFVWNVTGSATAAAEMYWDDFLATKAMETANKSNDDDDDDGGDDGGDDDDGEKSHKEEDNNRNNNNIHNNNNNNNSNNHIHRLRQDDSSPETPPRKRRRKKSDKDTLFREEEQESIRKGPAKLRNAQDPLLNMDDEENKSSSRGKNLFSRSKQASLTPSKRVHDANVERLVTLAKALMETMGVDEASALQKINDSPSPQQRPSSAKTRVEPRQKSLEETGFLPDDDWVWDALDTTSREKIPPTQPAPILWGQPTRPDEKDRADDEEEEEEETEREEEEWKVPLCWLRVGLQLQPETALGLVLPEPLTDAGSLPEGNTMGYHEWHRLSVLRKKKHQPQPPYYCRTTTAILAIVTALLHTGAYATEEHGTATTEVSYHTNKAGSASSYTLTGTLATPWTELTVQERIIQYDARLARALTCLFVRAATAARRRKLAYLHHARRPQTDNDNEAQRILLRRQAAERKLRHLCPVLGWPLTTDGNESNTGANTNSHSVPTPPQPVSYTTSLTAIESLHMYVASQIKQFQQPGGVALVLETILQLHGARTVEELLKEARGSGDSATTSLVHCHCMERDRAWVTRPGLITASRQETKKCMEPRLDCAGVELWSLLLTGTVHTSWQGWSTDPWGFGILSDCNGVLSKALTRPLQSVWVLAGPTTFSVLWADTQQPDRPLTNGAVDIETRSPHKVGGTVVQFIHWNPWYQDRALSKLRLTMGRCDWKPLSLEEKKSSEEQWTDDFVRSRTLRGLEMRRRERCRVVEQRQGLEIVDSQAVFTAQERAQVRPHPDDVKLYPNKYQLWRYDASEWPVDDNHDAKPRSRWVPFYRLTTREKCLVESSLGPSIMNILRTRWPSATLDALEPARPFPLV